jgi:hypothetical protein
MLFYITTEYLEEELWQLSLYSTGLQAGLLGF